MDNHTKKAYTYLTTPQTPESHVNRNDLSLTSLLQKIRLLNELNELISPYLEPSLRISCRLANITATKLIMITANATSATQLRFQVPDLLKKFKTNIQLAPYTDIQIKVRPISSARPASAPHPVPRLSPKAAAYLKDVLERLAKE